MSDDLKRRLLEEYRAARSPGLGRADANWAAIRTSVGGPSRWSAWGARTSPRLGVLAVGVVLAAVGGTLWLLRPAPGNRGDGVPHAAVGLTPAAVHDSAKAPTTRRLIRMPSDDVFLQPSDDPRWTPTVEGAPTSLVPKSPPGSASGSVRESAKTERTRPRSPLSGDEEAKSGSGTLEDEIELVATAKRALAGGDVSRALRLIRRHAAQFPEGRLVDERTLLQVRALCQDGQRAAATRLRDRFLARKPDTAISARIRSVCSDAAE